MAGIAAASGGALGMDVLPQGPDGRPCSAARDMTLLGLAGAVPSAVMPIALGWALGAFSSHLTGFRFFYSMGGLIGVVQIAILSLMVHPAGEALDRPCQCTRKRFRAELDAQRRVVEAGLEEAQALRVDYTKRLAAERVEDYRRKGAASVANIQ